MSDPIRPAPEPPPSPPPADPTADRPGDGAAAPAPAPAVNAAAPAPPPAPTRSQSRLRKTDTDTDDGDDDDTEDEDSPDSLDGAEPAEDDGKAADDAAGKSRRRRRSKRGKRPVLKIVWVNIAVLFLLVGVVAGAGFATYLGLDRIRRAVQTASANAPAEPAPKPGAAPAVVRGDSPWELVQSVTVELTRKNPGWLGKPKPGVAEGKVVSLELAGDKLVDLSPLRQLTDLRRLAVIGGGKPRTGDLTDLSPLKGMKLRTLLLVNTRVADLSPLEGMPLEELFLGGTEISDIRVVRGMPLRMFQANYTRIADLSPLAGAPLTHVFVAETGVTDLSPLKGSNLTNLNISGTKVRDLSPLTELPLSVMLADNIPAEDLTPLTKTPLRHIQVSLRTERDKDILRAIPTLDGVNQKPVREVLGPSNPAPAPNKNTPAEKKGDDPAEKKDAKTDAPVEKKSGPAPR